MRKSARRFGRPAKTTEEIIAEFQEEWDDGEYQEEAYGEEFEGEYDGGSFDDESIGEEEYEELYPEDEEYAGDFEEDAFEGVEVEYEEPEEYVEENPDEKTEKGYDPEPAGEETEEEYDLESARGESEEEYNLDHAQEETDEEYDSKSVWEESEEEYDPESVWEESEEEYDLESVGEEPEEEYEPEYTGEEPKEAYNSRFAEEESEYMGDEEYEEYIPELDGEEGEPGYYEDGENYEDKDLTLSSRKKNEEDGEDEETRILDRFILIAGAAVLLMALVTGIVFLTSRMRGDQAGAYREVGAQLAGVNLIGGQGLDAVANAQQVYADLLLSMATPEPVATPKPQSYDEQEYKPDINVQMNFSSIEKDLKIKFVNKETGKLISNVPFSITITDPDGSTVMWSDDDMDGIIYKKNLTPGQYRLVMNALTDEKYKSYGLVATEQKTEVKKEIEYKKVDVSDEVKTESQINVAKEDTKKNETLVESYLQDTVAWVESTSTMITYSEVAKSNIPDPMTLAMGGSFVRLSQENPGTEPLPETPSTEPSTEAPAETPAEPPVQPIEPPATEPPSTEPPTTESPSVPPPATDPPATEPPVQPVTPPPTDPPAVSVETPTPAPTEAPTPTPVPIVYVGRIDPASKAMTVGGQFTVTAACDGVTLQSISWTSSNPAAVTVDGNGMVTAVAATQQPVLISYVASGTDGAGNPVSGLTASCSVTVSAAKNLKLDKATELVYTGAAINLTATLENGADTDVLTVESSDTNVARAEISGRTVTVTGMGAGTANITVKYTENNNTISAACTVTVKLSPRENRSSLLKDKDGNELYVQENNNYRQAFYADYYTFDKFFKKGEAKYTGWQTINGAVKYFDINGNAVTGEQVIQGVKYNFASDGTLTVGSGTMGIDVSRWNGSIDWNAVKNSGVSYVIIRCGYRGSSQGTLIVDPMFQSNIRGATDAGLKVGVYFFTQAIDKVEAVEEASMVLELIKNYRISYPVFLDVESSGGRADGISKETRTEVCKTFCQTIQNGGYTAGIYANKTWLTEKIDPGQLGAYKIWLAQYASVPTYTGRYDMWQYMSTGKVSGIVGDVDLNLSYLGY